MPSYEVIGRHIYRASVVEQEAQDHAGAPVLVRQNGEMERVPVGTVLDDVTEAELVAFPDRFVLVEAAIEETEHAPSRGRRGR
jgi:hypothetical protein